MVQIISDSTCDLSAELLERYDIAVLPLHVLLGDQEYLDGKSITPDEIYTWSDAHKTTPKTSAASVEEIKKFFRPYLDAGKDIVCFSISSSMSGTYQNMCLAARELHAEERIRIIDSMNLSTGVGLQVIEAAEQAQNGASLEDIVLHIAQLTSRVRASFVVDTLTYLHRGGRCSGLAALAGGALRLHPRIAVTDGAMAPGKKYRGRMRHVLTEYVADMKDDLLAARPNRVFITHSGCDAEIIAAVKAQLEELHHFNEILITRAGSVISSHCGPGTLGVLFIA